MPSGLFMQYPRGGSLHVGGRGLELAFLTATGGCLGSWSDGPTFDYPHRTGAVVTLADNSLLFVGGLDATDAVATAFSERTDVTGTAVDVVASIGVGLKYASATLAADGKVYAPAQVDQKAAVMREALLSIQERRAPDTFGAFLALGLTTMISVQALVYGDP